MNVKDVSKGGRGGGERDDFSGSFRWQFFVVTVNEMWYVTLVGDWERKKWLHFMDIFFLGKTHV